MEIDLGKVFVFSKDSLRSRDQLRSIILDLYPHKTLEMNILLAVYESGIPREIKLKNSIDNTIYNRSINKIVNDYGLQEKHAIESLNTWLEQILGRDFIAKYGLSVNTSYNQSNNSAPTTNINNIQPQPIVHSPIITHQPVIGNTSDYELTYIDNDKVVIKKFVGFDEEVTTIPNVIEGKKVIGIGMEAFKQCSSIKEVIIPEGIEWISIGAFENCSKLEKISLPTSLKKLGIKSFAQTSIISVDLPNKINSIPEYCFSFCSKLTNIRLPDELKTICKNAFSYCSLLEEIVLTNNITKIESYAFDGCKNLSKVHLNEGLLELESSVFSYCKNLKELRFPSTVKTISDNLFDSGNITTHPTIYAYPGSPAIEFARKNNLPLKRAV